MAISEKIKEYVDKGLEVSKTAFDKGVDASKKAFDKASNAVQDFGDKSILKIEKKQFESKRDNEYAKLGKRCAEKFFAGEEVNASDEDAKIILDEIARLTNEIKAREETLAK